MASHAKFSVLNPFQRATPAPYPIQRVKLDLMLFVCLVVACLAYGAVSIALYNSTAPNISFSVISIPADIQHIRGPPLVNLWITGPVNGSASGSGSGSGSGSSSCGLTAEWFNSYGLLLTTANNTITPQQSFEQVIQPPSSIVYQQSGIFVPVYGTVDSNYLSIVGMVIPPACAGSSTIITVAAPPPGWDPTQYTFVAAINSRNFPITLLQGNVYSANINSIPKQTLQVQSNTFVQITISLTKLVKLDGSITYQYSMSPPTQLSPLVGYPVPSVVIAMAPSVTVQTEQRESVLVLVGSITGAWSAIFTFLLVLEQVLWNCFATKQVAVRSLAEKEHATAASDKTAEAGIVEDNFDARTEMQQHSRKTDTTDVSAVLMP